MAKTLPVKSTTSVIELNVDCLIDSNIPKRYWSLGVDTYFGDGDALLTARDWFDTNATQDLLLIGPTGSGKTFLATFLAKLKLTESSDVFYLTLDELVEAEMNRTPLRFPIKSTEFLVLDSVNPPLGKRSSFALARFLKTRAQKVGSTVICTQFQTIELLCDVLVDKTLARILHEDYDCIECSVDPARYEVHRLRQASKRKHSVSRKAKSYVD